MNRSSVYTSRVFSTFFMTLFFHMIEHNSEYIRSRYWRILTTQHKQNSVHQFLAQRSYTTYRRYHLVLAILPFKSLTIFFSKQIVEQLHAPLYTVKKHLVLAILPFKSLTIFFSKQIVEQLHAPLYTVKKQSVERET